MTSPCSSASASKLPPKPPRPVDPDPHPVPNPFPSGIPASPFPFRRLPRSFFERNTAQVARDLLGHWIVRPIHGSFRIGRIVETEAYLGPHDRASHSSRGLTPRNRSMFGPPGHAYVYLIYGLHHCLNVVTEPEGHGAAVLLRALEPVRDLPGNPRGPGLLCRALDVDRSLDGTDLLGDSLFLVEPVSPTPLSIVRSRRIGVDYAGPWARRLLRFHLRRNPWVSRP
ncbi:MAG: DNA-3-methyladenine glycosylase [Verrucomicrobiae bacterium]|nr:DNA-3-methyladenine glycosylase [Verrucomicrobiae bacterium]